MHAVLHKSKKRFEKNHTDTCVKLLQIKAALVYELNWYKL